MLKKLKRIKLRKQAYRRLMRRVLERDRWQCRRCGAMENLQIHHEIKRSQLGDDSLDNLLTLCARCHLEEHGELCFGPKAVEAFVKSTRRSKIEAKPALL